MVVTTNRNISMYDMLGNRVAPSIQQGGVDGRSQCLYIHTCIKWHSATFLLAFKSPLTPLTHLHTSQIPKPKKGFFVQNCRTPGSQCLLAPWELADPLAIGGDARVLYDRTTKRWYLTAFAVLRNASSVNLISVGNLLVAVSTSDDPTEPWRVLEVPSYPYAPTR